MQELEAHVRGQLEAVTEAGLIDDPTPAPEEDEEDTLESDLAEGLDFGQVMPSSIGLDDATLPASALR